jgi:hypothetical protein
MDPGLSRKPGMKVGDLVRSKRNTRLGLGLVTNDEHMRSNGSGYVWVIFQGWLENDKWCEVENLELISESRRLSKNVTKEL